MRLGTLAVVLLTLPGCAYRYSILDPAVYNPARVQDFADVTACKSVSDPLSHFQTTDAAASSLLCLSNAYADEGDQLRRQQLFFDIPMFALAAAVPISLIARAGPRQSLYLGVGAAGVAGTKTYFTPQTRIAAFSGASSSLFCAFGVARSLHTIGTGGGIADSQTNLRAALQAAPGDPDAANAKQALASLATAQDVIEGAPGRLQQFAVEIIRATDTRAATGSQNIDAIVAALRSVATSPAGTAKAGSEKPKAVRSEAVESKPILKELIATANGRVSDVNDAWAKMQGCALQAAGSGS